MIPTAMTTQNDLDAAGAHEGALAAAIGALQDAQRIAAATHITPDPDAIGSLLGFGHVLRHIGKEVILLCDDLVPASVRFLPGSEAIRSTFSEHSPIDLFVGLDASDLDRLGGVATSFFVAGIKTLVVDHHITNVGFGTVNLVNPDWSATAEGLVELFSAMHAPITPEAATCLLAGLVGDTRSFSTANTTAQSLHAGASLVAAGGDIRFISEMLFNRRSYETLRLWGIGLANAALEDGVCWTTITSDERNSIGLQETNSSGLSNLLISAEEANIAAVFTEQPEGTIDASFRARPGYDVATVALGLGGGGHALAAGAILQGPILETALNTVALLKVAAKLLEHKVPE